MEPIVLPIPEPGSNLTGQDFLITVKGLLHDAREAAFEAALLAGHVPMSMRTLVPVTITFNDVSGNPRTLTFQVTQDYLTIGTNDDRFRVPLRPLTHQRIADAWDCIMPTWRMVDKIWESAEQLPPQPWGPPYDATMENTDRMVIQSSKIDATLQKMNIDPTGLICGHKKDVILTNELLRHPTSVSIYGWHQAGGKPIQGLPLFMGHSNMYSDYSHGNRLVARACELDGSPDDIVRILKDPTVAAALSGEGVLKLERQPGA